MARPQMVQQQR